MRQIVNLVCVSALCLGSTSDNRKPLKRLKVFEKPSVLEKITALDAVRRNRIIRTFHQKTTESKSNSSDFAIETRVLLPTPVPARRADGGSNLETSITDAEHFGANNTKLNTDDNDTYYFGDDLNLTEDNPTIFVTPSPAQTLQSQYKSDLNNRTSKLSLNSPYQTDLYNPSLDQLFSSPTLPPETSESNEYPLTLVVKQSEGREEGLDINDHIANDILTPAFSHGVDNDYNDNGYSGKPQSLSI